jgi:hypothetical protein
VCEEITTIVYGYRYRCVVNARFSAEYQAATLHKYHSLRLQDFIVKELLKFLSPPLNTFLGESAVCGTPGWYAYCHLQTQTGTA